MIDGGEGGYVRFCLSNLMTLEKLSRNGKWDYLHNFKAFSDWAIEFW